MGGPRGGAAARGPARSLRSRCWRLPDGPRRSAARRDLRPVRTRSPLGGGLPCGGGLWVQIDTGMNRLGFRPGRRRSRRGLDLVMRQLACADDPSNDNGGSWTPSRVSERYQGACAVLRQLGWVFMRRLCVRRDRRASLYARGAGVGPTIAFAGATLRRCALLHGPAGATVAIPGPSRQPQDPDRQRAAVMPTGCCAATAPGSGVCQERGHADGCCRTPAPSMWTGLEVMSGTGRAVRPDR